MIIESVQQAKETLRSLNESLWILSAIEGMAETGGLALLTQETSLPTLAETTKVTLSVLQQTLHLLIETGFVISRNSNYILSPGMLTYCEQVGIEKLLCQLRVGVGLSRDFSTSIRHHTVKTGWHHQDEVILQSQGTRSEDVATDYIPQNARLHHLLAQSDATFLDVGTGVGKISLKLCELYKDLKIVALEPADAPHTLAKRNIDQANLTDRIELRKIFVQSLEDKNFYDAAWFPHMFFSEESFKTTLKVLWKALKPGGILLTIAISEEKPSQSLRIKQLMHALFGGLRSTSSLENSFKEAGFEDIEIFSDISGYRTLTACKPR